MRSVSPARALRRGELFPSLFEDLQMRADGIVFGIDAGGFLEVRERLIQPALAQINDAEGVMGEGVVGFELERFQEIFLGGRELA